MKRLITSVFFLIISVTTSNAQWGYVTPPEIYYGGNYVVSHDGALYFANNEDIWKTTDEGSNWTNLTNGFVTKAGNSNYTIEFAGNNIFVTSTLLAVFMSPDNGATWQMDTVGLEDSYQSIFIYCDGTNIYGSMNYPTYGFYMKAAAPGPWTRINSNSIGTSFNTVVLGMTKIGNNLFACTRAGTYESTDNGVTWTQKANSNYPGLVDFVINNQLTNIGSDLFLATADGVYKSADQADNWVRVDKGFATWDGFGVSAVWCLYTDGTNLYASMVHDDSAYVSKDGGTTWSDISDGLDHNIKSFAMYNGHLFAAQWDIDSSFIRYDGALEVKREDAVIPEKFALSQNYPNPFNPSTKIKFLIRQSSLVTLTVYDDLGKKVAELVNEELPQGEYSTNFDSKNLASGVYYYRLTTDKFVETKKMLLLR